MKTQIFPKEVLESTAEYHFYKNRSATRSIYQVILAFLFIAFVSLFLIRVDISVKSAGMFKPEAERNEVKALISGRIDKVFIKENMQVKAGQVLITIHKDAISGQSNFKEMQQQDYQRQLSDLQKLVTAYRQNSWRGRISLQSGVYRQQYSLFLQKLRDARAKAAAVRKNYERHIYLYNNKVISAAEFEVAKLELESANNQLLLVGETQGSQWQTDLSNLGMTVEQLEAQNKQLREEEKFYTLRSPSDGTIQNFQGAKSGSLVTANELLAEISPDDGLIAETYVLPKDIGLLKVGTKARVQVDAFNYNQWGMLTGSVISISNDVFSTNGQPYFKVRCRMDEDELHLKNGYTGRIKKGMTLQARFFVTRRSLSQLLYDKVDDWLNPNVMPDEKQNNELQAARAAI